MDRKWFNSRTRRTTDDDPDPESKRIVDTRVLPGTTQEQVQALTTQFQRLAYRMRDLLDARAHPQADRLVHEMLADLRAWRLEVQVALKRFARDPAATPADVLRERLAARLTQLEGHMKETLDQAGEGDLSERDGENFYRLIGAYRGLSEVVIEYASTAEGIEWDRWWESRF